MLNIFKKNKKNAGEKLRELLNGYEAPSFSSTVMGVLSTLRDPQSSFTEIAEQIGIDPGMHVNVLKTVNSAAFGLSAEVTCMEHAISLSGDHGWNRWSSLLWYRTAFRAQMLQT